mmetsp:Transcript_68200/g.137199  ORF Transcript_68200/g.137199 Transcript_68200/m.137199 type:complete len:81 (+) Transcript_68200:197-439(+)
MGLQKGEGTCQDCDRFFNRQTQQPFLLGLKHTLSSRFCRQAQAPENANEFQQPNARALTRLFHFFRHRSCQPPITASRKV